MLGLKVQGRGVAPFKMGGQGGGGRQYELCVHASFCLSGIVQTIGMQWEDYHGLGGNNNRLITRTTALPVLPTFAANLLAIGWLFQKHEGRRLFDRRMWWLVCLRLSLSVCLPASFCPSSRSLFQGDTGRAQQAAHVRVLARTLSL